jgi:hypothetical protein
MHSPSSGAAIPTRHTQSRNPSSSPIVTQDASSNGKVANKPSLDLLNRIKRMFRLLDLVTEQGSNGRGQLFLTLLLLL